MSRTWLRASSCVGLLVIGCIGRLELTNRDKDGGPPPQKPPPHVVGACDKLGAVGVWDNITPPGANLSEYGMVSVQVSPHNSAVVYAPAENSGLFKSSDCGATWQHINQGEVGKSLDKGSLLLVLDPIDANVLYASALYGPNGLFKSTNGGIDWVQILSKEVVAAAPHGGFVGHIEMDPSDHLHLLVSWHSVCAAPYTQACFAETKDGGKTWVMRNLDPAWVGGEGTTLLFLDSATWLFLSQSNGMWRSVDQGTHWTLVPGVNISHAAGQLYRTKAGAFFLGSANGILHSVDGATWTAVPNSGTLIAGMTGDGTSIWASSSYPHGAARAPPAFEPYLLATESQPMKWTKLASPLMTTGGAVLSYDEDHHVLYSSNFWVGAFRVVMK